MRVGGGPERVAPSILRERVAEWFETDDDGLLPAHEDGCAGDGGVRGGAGDWGRFW